jgi:putative membrane protein
MESRVRNHVPVLTGVLSVVSLALVFGAVLGALPTLPRAPDAVLEAIPHVNAALSLLAVGTISLGWRAIRRGNVVRHRSAMLASLGLFVVFLVLYLYRVSLLGPTDFGGPAVVERFVYLPVLGIHITLAIVCIPLLYYVLLLALSRPVSELPSTNHRRVGRVAAALWLVSFSLGVVVYALLYVVYAPVG